jgi:putative transposase
VEKERQEKGISFSCSGILDKLDLSRSGYLYYKKTEDELSNRTRRKLEIKTEIRKIHRKSKEIYGAPKIRAKLIRLGYRISERTVSIYMKEMGIKACYIRPYKVTTTNSNFDQRLKNFLQNNYNPTEPDTIWCSDITYINTEEGFVYLTSIMDLFSRKIISWRVSTTLETRWVLECVEEAKAKRKGTNPKIIHSDRGSQYVSQSYLDLLGEIKASYSDKASPWQNACIESFHALIKREWLYRFEIRDLGHARELIFEYIEAFYNTVRIHSYCGYLSPNDYEEQYQEELDNLEQRVA